MTIDGNNLASTGAIEGGELTPSLKVKRSVVAEQNKRILDALYT